ASDGRFWRKFASWANRGFLASIVAQGALSPLLITYFGYVSVAGFWANLFAVPLAALAMGGGALLVAADTAFSFALPARVAAWMARLSVGAFISSARLFGHSTRYLFSPSWSGLQIALWGGVIWLALFLWRMKALSWKRGAVLVPALLAVFMLPGP